jgi:2-keto-4-pentenoate hydratase
MSEHRIEAIAGAIAAARRSGRRIALADPPRDFEEGFAVQEKVTALLASPVIGWKVNELADGRVTFAPILRSGEVAAGGTWRVLGGEPAGIELEIAFRMARDVPRDAARAQILDCVGSAHVVFELCQSRIAEPPSVPRHVALADSISNHGVVVGPSFEGWRRRSLKGVPGRLLVDGRLHAEGRSADPVRALEVLPAALANRGRALQAGQIVITGSLIGMHWLTGCHALAGIIDGLGEVGLALEA